MEYTTLGASGISVSRIGLGCMSFGKGPGWWQQDWRLDAEESAEIVERAIDLGINFFDTANVYGRGASERILGDALSPYDRERFVVATKCYYEMADDDPNAGGLSRKAIERALDASLERLGMETIDLYQVHRWDEETPVETTMRALDDAVRRGTVRTLGASSMWAHQFAEALHASDRLDLERFATMQNHYNLAYREEEREMLPLCAREDVGVIPWSPLARGFLARPHESYAATARGETDGEKMRERIDAYRSGGGDTVNERVEELAADKGVSMAQISIAWLLHKDWVDAPIVGITDVDYLEEAVAALDVSLSDSEMAYLEEPSRPVPVTGHD